MARFEVFRNSGAHVNDVPYLLETPKLAAVPLRLLKQPVQSLAAEQAAITGALDFLFQGF